MQSLATCSSDKTIRVWNTKDYSSHKTLVGHNRWVWDCVFSSASDYLVTASSDNMARLWDIKEEKSIIQYTGHHKAIVCVALNDVDYATDSKSSSSSSSSSQSSQSQQSQQQQALKQQQQAALQAQQRQQAQRADPRQQYVAAATARQPLKQNPNVSHSPDDTDSGGSSPMSSGDEGSP